MQRLAGFGMSVLLALSLIGLGFDVALVRLDGEVVASAAHATPGPVSERGPRHDSVAVRAESVVARQDTTPPGIAASALAPVVGTPVASAPVVSASRALRVPRPRPVM